MVDNARQNCLVGKKKERLNQRHVAKEPALSEVSFVIISEIREVSMAAGHMFWPEGKHRGIFFFFHFTSNILLFEKETIMRKSSITRQINNPRKTLSFYNMLYKI